MPLGFATLPLTAEQLVELGRANYSIVDQAVRTPGLLIIQAPDEQATGDRRQATEEPNAAPDGAAAADAPDPDHPSVACARAPVA